MNYPTHYDELVQVEVIGTLEDYQNVSAALLNKGEIQEPGLCIGSVRVKGRIRTISAECVAFSDTTGTATKLRMYIGMLPPKPLEPV